MKKLLLFSALTMTLALGAKGVQKLPDIQGKQGPKVLIFNGGRPWAGEGMTSTFVKLGCRVRGIGSVYLDGFGGATIKPHISDPVEPEAFDGITPALKRVAPQKFVLFNFIPQNFMDEMLTVERIAQLRSYVENGGHVIFSLNAPTLAGDFLPVDVGELVEIDKPLIADRPSAKIYDIFPDKLPVFSAYRKVTPLPGAEVVSTIRDADGKALAPYIVRIKIGKGSVTFFNGEYRAARKLQELANWAYGMAFYTAVVADSAELDLPIQKMVRSLQPIPMRSDVGNVHVSLHPAENKITKDSEAPVIEGREVTFANGVRLLVKENGALTIAYPDEKKPFFSDFAIPQLAVSADRTYFNAATAEADDGDAKVEKIDLKWKFERIMPGKDRVTLVYTAPDAEMHWTFQSGKMVLDKRQLVGFSERVDVVKAPKVYINNLSFTMRLAPEDPLFMRRNDCYQEPRGYADVDMTGETSATTHFFGGQPFALLVCKKEIYFGMRATPQPTSSCFSRNKGEATILGERSVPFGRVFAPVSSDEYWHWHSPGLERGHNDYLAMYQFERHLLRTLAGLKEYPVYPQGHYTYQLAPEEKEAVINAIQKAGYRFIFTPGYETLLEKTFGEESFAFNQSLADRGMGVRVWSAGSYVQGTGGWIYTHHPEWFVREKDGSIKSYGGRYPVIDVNNEEFYQWFTAFVKKALDHGIKWVYRDMDGAAGNCINYALKESPHGWKSQLRFYQFFHANDCRVSVEGMNPLTIDEYWYRQDVYKPFGENEFALVGQSPAANNYEGLSLDIFRTGMYGCFVTTELSGYAFQFDRIPGEVERANRTVALVPKFNAALDHVGMPFIRETPFGTTWVSDKGGALFFWNPTKKAIVDLPEGWKIRGVEGNVLTDVPGDAVYLVDKE